MKLKKEEVVELYRWAGSTESKAAAKNVKALLQYCEYMEDRCEKIATILRQEMVARLHAQKGVKVLTQIIADMKGVVLAETAVEEVAPTAGDVAVEAFLEDNQELLAEIEKHDGPVDTVAETPVSVTAEVSQYTPQKKGRNR